jgi:hypothetical protein
MQHKVRPQRGVIHNPDHLDPPINGLHDRDRSRRRLISEEIRDIEDEGTAGHERKVSVQKKK